MLKRILTIVASLALFVPAAFAQTGTVTGTVTDASTGESVPGANVALVEINRGAATDVDGNYRIEGVPTGTYTLQVSFVGYQRFTTEVTIEAGVTLTQDVELEQGAVGLDEVVVTGYGTQQQQELTGSISNVSADEIQDVPSQNAQQLLQGRVAGVRISSNSGNPGSSFSVNIRGAGSINAGNEPLYIIDGVQMSTSDQASNTDRSPLNAIDPGDIESIEVLKDAAAAAIYGAQAANGVVLITTKSGSQGDVNVSLTMEGGIRSEIANFATLSPQEWRDFNVDAFNEAVPGQGQAIFRQNFLPQYGYAPGTPFSEVRTTDWEDVITRQGAHRKFGFSANGGDETTQFFVSGGWTSTQAAVRDVKFESFRFRTNLTQQLTDSFRLQAKLNVMSGQEPGVCQDGFFINCPWSGIQFEPPVTVPYNDDGSYNAFTTFGQSNNQEVVLEEEIRPVNTTQVVGSLQPTWNINEWLTFRGTAGLDYQKIHENDYESPFGAPGVGGSNTVFDDAITNITLNGTLNFNQTFNEVHDVTALVGTEYRREFRRDDIFGVQGFNNTLLRAPAAASQNSFVGTGSNTEFRLLSAFTNVDYNYDGRYLLSFTGRWDGTSRFGQEQQFGFFPSVSAGWRLSQEEFFDFDALNELKLRLSYGVTGNSEIGNFAARGLYNVAGSYEEQVGLAPGQLANPRLTWEENREINVGLDYAFLDNRISGSIDVYQSNTDELLLGSPLPIESGFGSITENIGAVKNEGIEFQISTVNVQTENFRWSTRGNFSINRNTVEELTGEQDQLSPGSERPIAVGKPLDAWKVPLWAGVNPADGRPMWYDGDGNLTYQTTFAEDAKFVDAANRDLVGGFGTNVSWKGLSFDAFFQFSYGGRTQPETIQFFLFSQGSFTAGHELLTKRWREPGDITSVPKAVPNGVFDGAQFFGSSSSYWLFDSSYLRLKSARLSYDLPSGITDALNLGSMRVYLSGSNLITWTSYIGLDPENANPETETSYPNERQINFGVQVDL